MFLRYLLGVELFNHRLESLLRLFAAPAKTAQTECKEMSRKLSESHRNKWSTHGLVKVILAAMAKSWYIKQYRLFKTLNKQIAIQVFK